MRILAWIACAALAACAAPLPHDASPVRYLHDERFGPPSEPVLASEVFALSAPMRAFLANGEFSSPLNHRGPQDLLFEALYRKGQLKLDYDATTTRNAAETFDLRAGNCLSLVIMTAAFARELGLQVHFHEAWLDPTWSHSGDFLLAIGHVNISLGPRSFDFVSGRLRQQLLIDFLPPEALDGLKSKEISEETILAMYLNNKAVEALVANRLDDAYAYARESVRQTPTFPGAFNTLGVIYLRHGDAPQATEVFRHVLEHDPGNTGALSNLADSLDREGRSAAAAEVRAGLARLNPDPPYHDFQLGQEAMRQRNYHAAQDYFAREVARDDSNHEFHFWLALADLGLGNPELARKQLQQAMETSASPRERNLYAAKLARLEAASLAIPRAAAAKPTD
jgi:tetratricopeptide (TPR) repeat protein